MINPEEFEVGNSNITYVGPTTYEHGWNGYVDVDIPEAVVGYARADLSGSWCDVARHALAVASGDSSWATKSCSDTASKVCSDRTLFVGTSGDDVAIRCAANCPNSNQSCGNSGGGGGGGGGGDVPICPATCQQGFHCDTTTKGQCLPVSGPIDPIILAGAAALVGVALLVLTQGPSSKTITIARPS